MPDVVGRLRAPRLSGAPASPAVGEMYFDTGANVLYWWNGSIWVSSTGGGGGSSWVSALNARQVLDVGVSSQIRAGRVITLADFTTTLGLSAPAGLWQLGNTGDSSGFSRNLVNKGALTFGQGVNGNDAGGAAYFTGNAGQALYLADTGTSDPFRIAMGSWGCWFKTAKRGTFNALIGKYTSASPSWWMQVTPSNTLSYEIGLSATTTVNPSGVTDIADDRWHFGVATYDGATLRLYIDGVLDAATLTAGGPIYSGPAPLNVGAVGADGSTNSINPSFGQIAQAFVTADVLSEDQVRFLYCARIPHTLGKVPTAIAMDVQRWRRGGALATSVPSPHALLLFNFYAGNPANSGSLGGQLVNNGGAQLVADADGLGPSNGGAFNFNGSQSLSMTDAGLPSGTTARSYGCWLKLPVSLATTGNYVAMGWGTTSTADARLIAGYPTVGQIGAISGSDAVSGGLVIDGQWHFAVCTEDNAALDGVKRKLYLDGKLVAASTVLNPITLVGAGGFRIGANTQGGGSPFTGQIDSPFVTAFALTGPQIAAMYASINLESQVLPSSAKDPGAHVEAMDASAVYATFDTLGSQHQVDLSVGA